MIKYIGIRIFHPGKKKFVTTSILVEVSELFLKHATPNSMFDVVVMPIYNELSSASIDAHFPGMRTVNDLTDKPAQSDYVGTIDEIIHQILNESGGDF